MDTAIGEVLDYLNFLELEETTYIIFMSDNGAGGRNGILKGGKGSLFEGGIRIPFPIVGVLRIDYGWGYRNDAWNSGTVHWGIGQKF